MILDCQNERLALQSIALYFKTDVESIKDILIKNNFEKLFRMYLNKYDYFCDFLYDYFTKNFSVSSIKCVMWFHLSRSLNPEFYYEGIFPLNTILPKLQKDLYNLVSSEISESEWKEICKGAGAGFRKTRYNMKVNENCHYGPYAMLVREIAFNSQLVGNHDYLKVPEIIEDMCMDVQKIYGVDVLDRFVKKASPIIVKFKEKLVDNAKDKYYIGTALTYLYNKLHGKSLSLACNMCYTGYGIGVEKNNIVLVEVLS